MAIRTPWHLWVVGIVAVLWNGMAAIDFAATTMQYEPYMESVAQAVKDHVVSAADLDVCGLGTATWAGLIGSLLLLLRRSAAVTLLALSLMGALGMLAVALAYPAPGGNAGLAAIIVAIAALLLLYTVAMRRQAVLA